MMSNIKSIWNTQLLPKYEEILANNNDHWFNHEHINHFVDKQQVYNNALQKYKKQHNKLLYGLIVFLLPISLLLIIPFYWVFKKFKKLKQNKDTLQQAINVAANEKLKIHKQLIDNTDFQSIINKFKDVIKYTHRGPIPAKLIDELQDNSLFDLSQYGKSLNPYTTSWGIFNNKIVIHVAKQQHHEYLKTYTGSKIFYYSTKNANGEKVDVPVTVSASYSHPYHEINAKKNTYAFMQSCSNLEFNFAGNKKMISFHNKKNHYSRLENSQFEKKFKWDRNDDVQFRMIFTLYAQEQFLNEFDSNELPPELQWKKNASFISNEYETTVFNFIIEKHLIKTIEKFISDADATIDTFKKDLYDAIVAYYHQIYLAMNYMYITTIMSSEDHQSIINEVCNGAGKINKNNVLYYAHNILNEQLKVNIIKRDTDCFNTLLSFNCKKIGNYDVYIFNMHGLSYDAIKKIIYINTYSSQVGSVDIPVEYIDFIPHTAEAKIIYSKIRNKNYYFYLLEDSIQTNINTNNEIKKILIEYGNKYHLCIRNGEIYLYLSSLNEKEFNEESFVNILNALNQNEN